MDIRTLKDDAERTLQNAAYPPRRLVLIHTGIMLGVSLVLALISYFLDHGVTTSGGLSGMDAQAALTTAQIVLQLVNTVAMPFWQAGLLFCFLQFVRHRSCEPKDLAEGFRRFKPLLSSGLMIGLQYLGRGFVSMYLSSMLVMLTPFAAAYYKLAGMLTENPELDITTLDMPGMVGFFVAYLVIFLLVYGALVLPVFYRYRMVNYIIMDDAKIGGIGAMFISRAMMRGRRMKLFRLDLSFWWFYGAEILMSVVAFGDLLLAALGLTLPLTDGVSYWLFQMLAVAGQLGLYYLARPKLEATYALCYESFRQSPEPVPQPKPQPPREHPWTY